MIFVDHLETNVVNYCDNQCVSCSHFANRQPYPWKLEPEPLYRDCVALARLVHCRDFFLIGGEPLLHPNLIALAEAVRASGLTDRVGLLTNGNHLNQVEPRLFEVLDIIDVSRYDGRPYPSERVRVLCQAHQVELYVHDRPRFHRLLTAEPRSEAEARQTFADCPYGKECYLLEFGYLYLCASAPVIPGLLLGLDPHSDGIEIASATEATLRAYLEHTDRDLLQACRRCAFEPDRPWRELRAGEDWWVESAK